MATTLSGRDERQRRDAPQQCRIRERRPTAMLLGALLVPGMLLPAACGGDDGGAATRDGAAEDAVTLEGDRVEVSARDNEFVEENIRIASGATVKWENLGRQDHDIVAVENGWGAPADDFAPGDTYERTFDEPGTYRYYCSLHGDEDAGMTGTVIVE